MNYRRKYKEQREVLILIIIIAILTNIFLLLNIKIRNEQIWKLKVENSDLKEQIDILNFKGENK